MTHPLSGDLNQDLVARAYERWAPVYDAVCGPIMAPGRRAAARAASAIGGAVLEIGVGTGLSFPHYKGSIDLIGIDLSDSMIAQARRRVLSGRYTHVRGLYLMDAHKLRFPDASFNCVVAPFMLTLVQDPEHVLSEALRVVKPGGQVIVVSHFGSDRPWTAAIERWVARRAKSWGLRPDFPLDRIERWRQSQLHVESLRWKHIAFGTFTLVRIQRRAFIPRPVPNAAPASVTAVNHCRAELPSMIPSS